MDVILILLAALLSAAAVTWLIFYLARRVENWAGRQFALFWICGAGAVIALFIATAHVPNKRSLITTACDPSHDTACRATGAPHVSAAGDTICCYPGVKEEPFEQKSPEGEAAKISFIMLAVGTMFGLIMLTHQWLVRPKRRY